MCDVLTLLYVCVCLGLVICSVNQCSYGYYICYHACMKCNHLEYIIYGNMPSQFQSGLVISGQYPTS